MWNPFKRSVRKLSKYKKGDFVRINTGKVTFIKMIICNGDVFSYLLDDGYNWLSSENILKYCREYKEDELEKIDIY